MSSRDPLDYHSSQGAHHFSLDSFTNQPASQPNINAPLASDQLDIDAFMLEPSSTQPLQSGLPLTDANSRTHPSSQFADFSFPFSNLGDSPVPEPPIDPKVEPILESQKPGSRPSVSEHRNSITSAPQHRGSVAGSMAVAPPQHTSVDGSDDASPPSARPRGTSLAEGYSDEFGLSGNNAADGSDLGSKNKDEKGDAHPPWTELKTKAGKERKRLPLACIACRRKKIRCSGEKPACKHCLRSRIPCVYKVTTRKAAPRTDYMAMLDKRLKRMEERIIKIVPKEEQDTTTTVTRATVKPALPGAAPVRNNSGTKRGAAQAFGRELESWAKSVAPDPLSGGQKPAMLIQQEAEENRLLLEGVNELPSKEIQEHLAEVFFEHVQGQTYHLLHKPSFMRKLRAGQIPPVLILAICAVSARFSTHPKLNTSPAFLRGENWASEARSIVMRRYDWPNITILTCHLILGLHEFGTCQGGRSWSFGGMAIRMAYALQLHRDLDHDPCRRVDTELSFIDREIRRRTMWACFLMDRFNSSGTERPIFIKEDTVKVQLPIKEQYFQLDIAGPTEDLAGEVPHPVPDNDGQLYDAKANMGVAAYMVRTIALWGRIINYLNLGGRDRDSRPLWHPEAKFGSLCKQADEWAASLPGSLKYTAENLRNHETEGLANQFIFLHIAGYQNILFLNRFAIPTHPRGSLPGDMPKDFASVAASKAVAAAGRISELLKDAESHFVTAPFTGYCAFLSSTVHIIGAFSRNPDTESTAKMHLTTNVKYLTKMKRYWGMFHWMTENLKTQYRACADALRQGNGTSDSGHLDSSIFQYGDWFDRYPHGVSQSDFEEADTNIKKEKGEDAVLEKKSDYSTVEDFFHTLPSASNDANNSTKRRQLKKPTSQNQPQPDPLQVNMQQPIAPEPTMQLQNDALAQQYNTLPSPINHNHFPPNYNNDLFMVPHHGGLLPQLDRQLVFGAYAGSMEPGSLGGTQGMMDSGNQNGWGNVNMNSMPGFTTEPSSAWFMPFNMEPPEIGNETDIFAGMGNAGMGGAGGAGYGVGGSMQVDDGGVGRGMPGS